MPYTPLSNMGVFGVGIDLCKVARMQAVLSKPATVDRFLAKVLHEDERKLEITAQFLASRWAAKEALVKASGRTDLQYHLIRVHKLDNGRPGLTLSPSEMSKLTSLGVTKLHLSLTHEDDYAAAVVLLESSP